MALITAAQAARILNINKRTLFRWEEDGRIRTKREGVLKVRVYDKNYIEVVKKILELNAQEKSHLAKFPEIMSRVKEHIFMQDVDSVRAGEPLRFIDVDKATVAFDDEEAWMEEHKRILNELFSYPREIIKEVLHPV